MVVQRRIHKKKNIGWIILAIFLICVMGMFTAMLVYSAICLGNG